MTLCTVGQFDLQQCIMFYEIIYLELMKLSGKCSGVKSLFASAHLRSSKDVFSAQSEFSAVSAALSLLQCYVMLMVSC